MARTHFLRALFCIGTSAFALANATEAAAQTPPPAAARDKSASPSDDEIIVTAQRREQAVNSIGMGIQAFTGAQLDRLHVTDVKDLSSVAPSFSVQQSYQGVPIYTLRGIGFNTINLSATSTVGSYVDEVAYPFPFMMTGPIFDVSRVEVLKGPQGTLYGRNTTAGLIDFITNRPTRDTKASLTADIGNYQTYNLEGFFSAPISDSMRFRVAFRSEDTEDGWQKSNTRAEDQGEVHRLGGRARFEWNVTDALLAELTVSGWKNQSDTIVGQGIGFTPATDPALNPLAGFFNAGGAYNPAAPPGLISYLGSHFPTSSTQADWEPAAQRGANLGIGAGLPGDLAEDNTFGAGALRLTYDLNPKMRVVSLTGYNDLKRDALFDWSGAPYEILVQRAQGSIQSFSEELRLDGQNERVNWLVGAYYGQDKISDNNRTMLGQNYNVARIRAVGQLILAGIDPLTNTPGLLVPGYSTGSYTPSDVAQSFRTYRDVADIDAETRSVFANADWKLTDALSLTTGLRFTEDEHSYRGCSADFNGSMLPNVNVVNRYLYTLIYSVPTPAMISANDCVTFDPATGAFGEVSHRLKESNTSWRVALDWKVSPSTLFYTSVSQGYKAGVTPVNAANIASQQDAAHQESLLAYEAGAKLGLFDRRVQLNLSGFYYDYRDKQISTYFADPIYTALARLQNVPDSRAAGIDADVTWRATDDLTLTGSATYLDTKVIDYHGIGPNGLPHVYDGVPFPYAAKWQLSGTAIYSRPITSALGLQAALNGRWQSRTAADLGDSPSFVIDSYGVVNASVGIHANDDRWALQLWGRNITDTYYWTSVASNANVVVRFPGQAPTYGLSLTLNY